MQQPDGSRKKNWDKYSDGWLLALLFSCFYYSYFIINFGNRVHSRKERDSCNVCHQRILIKNTVSLWCSLTFCFLTLQRLWCGDLVQTLHILSRYTKFLLINSVDRMKLPTLNLNGMLTIPKKTSRVLELVVIHNLLFNLFDEYHKSCWMELCSHSPREEKSLRIWCLPYRRQKSNSCKKWTGWVCVEICLWCYKICSR